MNPLLELKRGIYASLAGDPDLTGMLGGNGIYDHPPPDAGFPYITFGRTSSFDWETASEPGWEILFSLHVWSRSRSTAELSGICARIGELLHGRPLEIAAYHVPNLRQQRMETAFDAENGLHHATLQFRAVVEQQA